ncbi:MAG: hypothetical protein ACI8WT_003178 [Clostridium sp.]|jgi:hypothetical protein
MQEFLKKLINESSYSIFERSLETLGRDNYIKDEYFKGRTVLVGSLRNKEYLIKGFSMNDDLLKKAGGGSYWQELLERIRDIRSSEKVFYRQILDIYGTSVDYTSIGENSVLFFQTVQNKMHYAAHGHTATEVLMERANAG